MIEKIFQDGVKIAEITHSDLPPALSKLEFMARLTQAELVAIYTAKKTSVEVEIFLTKFSFADEIHLDNPELIQNLQNMEAAGLLATGRAMQILEN